MRRPTEALEIYEKVNMKTTQYLAIGDIHGCWRELNLLLSQLENKFDFASPKTKLVFLGDYIDRGESSYRVVQTLMGLQTKFAHFEFLMGNHEHMHLKYKESFEINDLPREPNPEIDKFLRELKPYVVSKKHLFVHGGPADDAVDLKKVDIENLLWNYDPSPNGWKGRTIVRGHSPVAEVKKNKGVISVDTGCCFGNKLSCAVITDKDGLTDVISVSKLAVSKLTRVEWDLNTSTWNTEKNRLAEVYRQTTFRVIFPKGNVNIRIGALNADLENLFLREGVATACFVTADNPESIKQSLAQNHAAQNRLKQDLKNVNLRFYEGNGIPDNADWEPEASVLILGIGLEESIMLGNLFGQSAIVFCKRGEVPKLYWCREPQ